MLPDRGAARPRRDPRLGAASPTSRCRAAAASTPPSSAGVESPWERIRALRARTKTPLALALRGRFLVGSRPVGGDFVRRFVASAAESGIDVFRLHDPLNDVSNLREASEAITAAGREFDAGLVYSPGPSGETDALVAQAQRLPELGAARVLIHDPSGSLEPHRVRELVEAIARGERPSGRSLLPGRRRIGARRGDRGGAGRRRPDRLRGLPGRARPPPCVRRGGRRTRSTASAFATGVDAEGALARLRPRRRAHQRPAGHAARPADRHPGRRAQPSGRPDRRARPPPARALGRRPARRGDRRARRGSAPRSGWPPLAAPIGQVLASQALLHVLAAERYQTVVDELRDLLAGTLRHAARRDLAQPSGGRSTLLSALGCAAGAARSRRAARAATRASPRARRSCSCSRSSATKPSRSCETIRGRGRGESLEGGGVGRGRAPSGSARSSGIVQESGVGEVTIEDAGLRVTVRQTPEQRWRHAACARARP